jgi:hypothetical protein
MKTTVKFGERHWSGMNAHKLKAFDTGLLSRLRLPFASQDNITFYHPVVGVALPGHLKLV